MGSIGKFYLSHMYLLELEGKPAGRLYSAELPTVKSNVISSPGTTIWHKSIPTVPSDFKIKFGTGMSRAFYEWIASDSYNRKNGAIVLVDSKMTELHRVEFSNALVTSFWSPQLDHASKSAAAFMASIQPERLIFKGGGGKANGGVYLPGPSKTWMLSDFGFTLSGLEKESSKTTKIDAFTLKQGVKAFYIGQEREPLFEPTASSVSNLVITMPLSDGIFNWSEQMINGGVSNGKAGSLEYTAPKGKSTYFNIEFKDLMVLKTSFGRVNESQSQKPVTIEISFSSLKFSAHSSAVL